MKDFIKLAQWPALFVAVTLLTGDKMYSTIVILSLVFRPDLSRLLRLRHLTIESQGFKARITDGSRRSGCRQTPRPS